MKQDIPIVFYPVILFFFFAMEKRISLTQRKYCIVQHKQKNISNGLAMLMLLINIFNTYNMPNFDCGLVLSIYKIYAN